MMTDHVGNDVGSVVRPDGTTIATLRGDGIWEAGGNDMLADALDGRFSGELAGPHRGAFGVKQLHDAARLMGGSARVDRDLAEKPRDGITY